MEVKSLDRRIEEGIKLSISKMAKLKKNNIDYYIFAMKIKEIDKPITRVIGEKEITILDKEYTNIQILPIGKNYSLTIYYDKLGDILLWNLDITSNNFLDDRGVPFYEDLYLDIVLTRDNSIYVINQEELENAYKENNITKEQYDLAKKQAELLNLKISENVPILKKVATKYFDLFFKKKIEKVDNRNTYRVNIKPGIKVAIVLKKDQKTGILTKGIVKDILTNSAIHHRGIKVRLEDGQVGRVQKILD